MAAGAGARRWAPVQSASVAVVATVTAMIVALGVSVAATTRAPQPDQSALVARAAQTRPAPDGAQAASSSGQPASRRRSPVSAPPVAGDGRGAEVDAATHERGDGRGTAATTQQHAVAATNGAGARTEAGEALHLRPARPGDWAVQVTTSGDVPLLGGGQQQAETALRVAGAGDGVQQLRLAERVAAVTAEDVRYDEQGRRAAALEVWTGSGDPLTFRSVPGFLDMPAMFRPGESWRWSAHTDDRRTSIDATLRLEGRSTRTVGGREVAVVGSSVEYVLGGDRSGSVSRHVWFAPDLGLPVEIDEVVRVTNPDGQVSEWAVELRLLSDEPAQAPLVPGTEPGTTTTTTSMPTAATGTTR